MAKWKRLPQERNAPYFFSGHFVVTKTVMDELSNEEIMSIYLDVRNFVKESGGGDYLQIYVDDKNRRLVFIDQLNQEMIESGEFRKEVNYCSLLFDFEY